MRPPHIQDTAWQERAAVGMAIGLVVAPALLAVLPGRPVVMLGFVLVVGVMFALPFVHEIARELDQRTFLPLSWLQDWLNIRREIATTALVLPLVGLGVSLVEVGSRTALYRASPAEKVGQVLSTKSTVAAMASIVPTLAAGIMLDLISVEVVMLTMATAATALAGFSWFRSAPAPSTAHSVSPVGGSS